MIVAEIVEKLRHAEAMKDDLIGESNLSPFDEDVIEIIDEYIDILGRMKVVY